MKQYNNIIYRLESVTPPEEQIKEQLKIILVRIINKQTFSWAWRVETLKKYMIMQ